MVVLITHGMWITMDGEESGKKRNMIIRPWSSIKMRDPFCFDERLRIGLPIVTLSTMRNTTVILKSSKVPIYCSKDDPEKGLPAHKNYCQLKKSTDLHIEVPMKNVFQHIEFL